MKRFLLCVLSVLTAGVMLASCAKDEGIQPSSPDAPTQAEPTPVHAAATTLR